MASLLSDPEKAEMEAAIADVFDTFKRPWQVYAEAMQVNISTSSSFSRFGQHDQNVSSPQVTPQVTTIYGCVSYDEKMALPIMEPYNRTDGTQQLKIVFSEGGCRIKVDAAGNEILKSAKRVNLDGFNFVIDSTPRPRGLFTPQHFTYILKKLD